MQVTYTILLSLVFQQSSHFMTLRGGLGYSYFHFVVIPEGIGMFLNNNETIRLFWMLTDLFVLGDMWLYLLSSRSVVLK